VVVIGSAACRRRFDGSDSLLARIQRRFGQRAAGVRRGAGDLAVHGRGFSRRNGGLLQDLGNGRRDVRRGGGHQLQRRLRAPAALVRAGGNAQQFTAVGKELLPLTLGRRADGDQVARVGNFEQLLEGSRGLFDRRAGGLHVERNQLFGAVECALAQCPEHVELCFPLGLADGGQLFGE
jgi:hypothetical protein